MKPFTPDPIYGIPFDKDEPLYYAEEGTGGYIPISVSGAKKKNEGTKRIGIFRAVNSFHNTREYDELVLLGGKTPRFEKNLRSLRACYCEVDLRKEGEGAEITEEQKDEVIDTFSKSKMPPSFYVKTKNGIHLWFAFGVAEGTDLLAKYKECNEGLRIGVERKLGVKIDNVKDAARVLRAPGYAHRKGETPYPCNLVLPEKSFSYTIEEIHAAVSAALPVKTRTDKEYDGEVSPSMDKINRIPVKTVARVCWPELIEDPSDPNKFLDSSNNNHPVAMFLDRSGINCLHGGGGSYIDISSGPYLLIRNRFFPITKERTRGVAALETIEWFCEHFDIESRRQEYDEDVMDQLKKECMYGEVGGQKCILFPKITDSGETVGLTEVPITDSAIIDAHVMGWMQRRGYAAMIDGSGKLLADGERKKIHKGITDMRKMAIAHMRGFAATGPEITPIIRVSGDKNRIRLSDKQGFYEITGSGWERRGYDNERLLIRSDCDYCEASNVDIKELNTLVPLLSTFKSGEAGGRFLAAYTVCAHLPFVENPPFLFLGDPNTAKTSKMKTVTAVVDPDNSPTVPRLCETSDKKDVTAAASLYWIICIDNKGNLTADESDFLCTMFSGGKQIRRTLHTNLGVTTQDLRRPCLITAIKPPKGIKTDLWDRFMALESGFGEDIERMGSMDFDEVLSDALPTVRGACYSIISQLITSPPRARADILVAAKRKQGWAHYMQGVYELMGWDVEELLACLEESNNFVMESEKDTTPMYTCFDRVMDDLYEHEGGRSSSEWSAGAGDSRIDVQGDVVKIGSNLIIERIREKAAAMRLHPAAMSSLPETGRGLTDFFRFGEQWMEEAGYFSERCLVSKHRLAGWKITKKREGERGG
jgi:hypothetical protein